MKNKIILLLSIVFCFSKFSSAQTYFHDVYVWSMSRAIAGEPIIKSTTELLTQNEWILTATGFDDNNNGVLDASENTIQNFDRGNSYIFNTEGVAYTYNNSLSCAGSSIFKTNWKLSDNDTKLGIGSENMIILQLNENELVLNPQLPRFKVKFLMIYRH